LGHLALPRRYTNADPTIPSENKTYGFLMRNDPPKRGLNTNKSCTKRPSVRMRGVGYGQREKSALGPARRERALAGLEESVAVIEEAEAGWPSAATPDLSRPFGVADLSKAEIRRGSDMHYRRLQPGAIRRMSFIAPGNIR